MSYTTEVLADSPVAYWRLGEPSGTVGDDEIGALDLTYVNAPTLGVAGALLGDANTAVDFNGTDEYMERAYSAALNPEPFSVECWARVDAGSAHRSPVSSRDPGASLPKGYIIYALPGNVWSAWFGNGVDAFWHQLDASAVTVGVWTHLVLTHDGTDGRFYINGAQAAFETGTGFAPQTAQVLRVGAGANEGAPQFYFDGAIDEVAIYGTALSPARISAHYLAGITALADLTTAFAESRKFGPF